MKVEFLYDFGSPNAYFAHRVLPQIEARTGVKFCYLPILLGGVFKLTNNKSPIAQFADIKNKLAYERLEIDRFIRKHGLSQFHMNPNFPVNTLTIMRGAIAAERDGVAATYIETMFRAMWEDGRKLDDLAVVVATLKEAGTRWRAHRRANTRAGGQGRTRHQYRKSGGARHLWRPYLLRRRPNLFRQGSAARRRGSNQRRTIAIRRPGPWAPAPCRA